MKDENGAENLVSDDILGDVSTIGTSADLGIIDEGDSVGDNDLGGYELVPRDIEREMVYNPAVVKRTGNIPQSHQLSIIDQDNNPNLANNTGIKVKVCQECYDKLPKVVCKCCGKVIGEKYRLVNPDVIKNLVVDNSNKELSQSTEKPLKPIKISPVSKIPKAIPIKQAAIVKKQSEVSDQKTIKISELVAQFMNYLTSSLEIGNRYLTEEQSRRDILASWLGSTYSTLVKDEEKRNQIVTKMISIIRV